MGKRREKSDTFELKSQLPDTLKNKAFGALACKTKYDVYMYSIFFYVLCMTGGMNTHNISYTMGVLRK